MDNFGEFLVAVSESDRRLLVWKLSGDATPITAEADVDCPTVAKSLVVTAERSLMVFGSGNNPRQVTWSDREDYTTWTPTPTNEAGDFELATNGAIETGLRVRNRTLILTTLDAFAAIYQGPPVVYGFQRVGIGCGIAGPQAAVAAGGRAYWMGAEAFYVYDGAIVQELPCEVYDKVFDEINRNEIRISWAVDNQRNSEVWWFYPSGDSLECDRYVVFNYQENYWTVGNLQRNCGVDVGVFRSPLWLDSAGAYYFHETGFLFDGTDPYIETGPVMLGNGHEVMYCTQMLTDERTVGECFVSFNTLFYPDGPEYSYGPYTLPAPPVDVRFTGRQIRMRITGAEGTDWRMGPIRLRTQERARR